MPSVSQKVSRRRRTLVPSSVVLAVLAVASGTACGGEDAVWEAFAAEAESRAAAFQAALKAELVEAMSTGGPASAVRVCKERAPALAAEASQGAWTLRRVGTRIRNPRNVVHESDREALEFLASHMSNPLRAVRRFRGGTDGSGNGFFWRDLYVPLVVQPACLTCHGPVEGIPETVRAALDREYPEDAAVGYAVGDLRGAVVVTRKEELR